MKRVLTLLAAGAMMIGTGLAQNYPQQSYPQNDPQQNYPQQQYPQNDPQQNYPQQGYPHDQRYPQAGYPQQTYPQQGYPQDQNYPQSSVNSPNGSIPAGTELQIRTNEKISATKDDQAALGRQFSAEIARDVMGGNGQLLIPKGSPATLTVGNVNSGTAGVQSNEVALALQSVSVNGRTYNLQSNSVNASNDRGIGANKRTAVMTGGGALLGTLIGAMAGGGKGAAIGAAVGAAGGATTQVLTRGHDVNVPAESLLTFRLDQPLSLY